MGCVISDTDYRWPRRTVPFEISDEFPPGSSERNTINMAIREWNAMTVVTLEERDGQSDYVEFVRGDDCLSAVGRQGGKQSITCSYGSVGGTIHEIGHAVGLWHEHTRQDRNLFVIFHPENVQPDQLYNFEMHIDDGDTIGPYDYDSIMHYGPRSRAIDWRAGSVIEGQTSKAAPALAAYGSGLHMVHLGDSSNDIWWSIYDGTVWRKSDGTPGNERIQGQRSKATPALAAFGNELHMVHLGDSSNNIWWSIYDGTSWNRSDGTPGNEQIPGQSSKAAPALAGFFDGLHMVHLGDSSNNIWWSIYDGTSWKTSDGTPGNEQIPGQQSKAAPTLAPFTYQLHLVHIGNSSNNIWNSTYSGDDWSANRRKYYGQSKAGPVMAALAGSFYMLHSGSESTRIWQTLYDISLYALVPPPGVVIGGQAHLSAGDVQAVAVAYA
jgi:hypothetical protein